MHTTTDKNSTTRATQQYSSSPARFNQRAPVLRVGEEHLPVAARRWLVHLGRSRAQDRAVTPRLRLLHFSFYEAEMRGSISRGRSYFYFRLLISKLKIRFIFLYGRKKWVTAPTYRSMYVRTVMFPAFLFPWSLRLDYRRRPFSLTSDPPGVRGVGSLACWLCFFFFCVLLGLNVPRHIFPARSSSGFHRLAFAALRRMGMRR